MRLLSVLTDVREPSWIKQLTFGGVPVASTMLDAGDLLCACDDGNLLSIERKSSGDFLNTLRDDRLFPQVAKLRETTPYAYLLVTGTLHPGPHGTTVTDERETQWQWASVAGALLTVQELGVHVLQVGSELEYEAAVMRLAARDRGVHRVVPARDMAIVSEQEQVLAALPGIGSERAQLLLQHCGEPYVALSYLTCPDKAWELDTVPGIGEGIKRRIRRTLGMVDGWMLSPVPVPERNGEGKA